MVVCELTLKLYLTSFSLWRWEFECRTLAHDSYRSYLKTQKSEFFLDEVCWLLQNAADYYGENIESLFAAADIPVRAIKHSDMRRCALAIQQQGNSGGE